MLHFWSGAFPNGLLIPPRIALTIPPAPPARNSRPLLWNVSASIAPSWIFPSVFSLPVRTLHSTKWPSVVPHTSVPPSGRNAIALTVREPHESRRSSRPVLTFQRQTNPLLASEVAVASSFPVGSNSSAPKSEDTATDKVRGR